jgi:hypothetical protein
MTKGSGHCTPCASSTQHLCSQICLYQNLAASPSRITRVIGALAYTQSLDGRCSAEHAIGVLGLTLNVCSTIRHTLRTAQRNETRTPRSFCCSLLGRASSCPVRIGRGRQGLDAATPRLISRSIACPGLHPPPPFYSPTMAPRTRTHARTHSAPRISIASSSSSVSEDAHRAGPVPRRVAIVGSGREALALSPLSAVRPPLAPLLSGADTIDSRKSSDTISVSQCALAPSLRSHPRIHPRTPTQDLFCAELRRRLRTRRQPPRARADCHKWLRDQKGSRPHRGHSAAIVRRPCS